MKTYLGFVAVSLFLLSCTNTDRDNPYDMWGSNYMGNASAEGSSSSVETGDGPSSSSVAPSSSSVEPSSSSALPSPSSGAESSSSVVLSSSSAVLSSSSAPPSSSSTAPSSSSVAPSSSSTRPSSSSVAPSSSSNVGCAGFVNGTKRLHYEKEKEQFCDERDGKKYVYVKIGEQTWMAENLNYDVDGSMCYNNSESICNTYGRLYHWLIAMVLPSSCNSISCSSQIESKHRGICPNGWHLPSKAEWDIMTTYIGGADTEGKKLKATSNNSYSSSTDEYGFSALSSGRFINGNGFYNIGNDGIWWSSSEYNEYNSNGVYSRTMIKNSDGAYWYSSDSKSSVAVSVRCLKD